MANPNPRINPLQAKKFAGYLAANMDVSASDLKPLAGKVKLARPGLALNGVKSGAAATLPRPSGLKAIDWDKVDTSSLAAFTSNVVNALRKPPLPAQPYQTDSISLPRVNLDAARSAVREQTRQVIDSADATLPAQQAAAVKGGMLATSLRQLSDVSEKEALMNTEQQGREVQANAAIRDGNRARTYQYEDALVNRTMAHQREQSANLANAADKYLAIQNDKAERQAQTERMSILSQAYAYGGVNQRVLDGLKKLGIKGLEDVQYAGGGDLPGPGPRVSPQQATQDAKGFFARRHIDGVRPEDIHTGGAVPRVTLNGTEIPYGMPLNTATAQYKPVPSWATEVELGTGGREAWYRDRNGDLVPMDPRDVNLPQFRKKPASYPVLAKLRLGGGLKRL